MYRKEWQIARHEFSCKHLVNRGTLLARLWLHRSLCFTVSLLASRSSGEYKFQNVEKSVDLFISSLSSHAR